MNGEWDKCEPCVMCCEREILKIIIDLGRGRVNREWCKLL